MATEPTNAYLNLHLNSDRKLIVLILKSVPTLLAEFSGHRYVACTRTHTHTHTDRMRDWDVAWWENGKSAFIRLTGHHSPLIRLGSSMCACACVALIAGMLGVQGFRNRRGDGGLFRACVRSSRSVSQLAAAEGKYLGPGKETCISPPELQNNNSLFLQPGVSASQNSSNYHTSLHSFEDLIVPGSSPADSLLKIFF